ncbi:MAG: aminoglycoside phosphotransferase family protein [Gammaproteobacteria bacterium]|nr:aminoglycoside phosphotransferase family protein [Gammaproteobacteria bacterium]
MDGRVLSVEAFGKGHINDTWRVTTASHAHYMLQRINTKIFTDPVGVITNTIAVCRHLQGVAPRLVPQVVVARNARPAVSRASGVYRMLEYVHGRAGAAPLDDAQAHAAGHAFGRFQRALADYDATRHTLPIPGFLELAGYLRELDAALATTEPARRDRAGDLIARVVAQRHFVLRGQQGPAGMIHGDCKVDNLIFDETAPAVRAVVDLDTVMWGRRAWDFGDLVRSASVRGAEDAADLRLHLSLYTPIAEGFARGLGDLFDASCAAACVDAPAYVALMLGTRFLTDFLVGDRYFKVSDDSHNLRRAAAQLSVFDSAVAQRETMARILYSMKVHAP